MVNKLKTILLFAISYLLLALPSTAFAQTASNSSTVYGLPSTVSPTSPLYTDLIVHNLFHSFSCLAAGQSIIGQPCLTYQLTQDAQGALHKIPVLSSINTSGGMLGATTSFIGALYTNQPVRTIDYLASIGKGFGFVKEADAQVAGSGAQVLNPVLALWQTSRNISYVIMIIIFIIIGLMVMFRNKINPQTVITAQAALPGLVIGLIMITFSYFFAGLISDTAFVGTNIVGYYFSIAQRPKDAPQNLVQDASSRSILNVFIPFTRILDTGRVRNSLGQIWDDLGDPNIPWYSLTLDAQRVIKILAMFLASQLLLPIGNLAPGLGTAAGALGSIVGGQAFPLDIAAFALAFVGLLALIYTMLKLLLRLITAYLTIIILTFTAPFQLLVAALPGRQGIATDWVRGLLANVLAFPAVLAAFYFVAIILGDQFTAQHCDQPPGAGNCLFKVTKITQTQNNTIVPTVYAADSLIVDTSTFPLFGGLDLEFIKLLLAFGALLATPSIPDIVVRSISKASQAGQLIGQEIGAGTGAGQRYAGQIQQGTTGSIGQVGRLTDERGWYMNKEGNMVKVNRLASEDLRARLTTAGQATRIRGTLGELGNWAKTRFGR